MASNGNAKALIGVIFLQYCSYSLFYLADEFSKIAPQRHKQFKQGKENRGEAYDVDAESRQPHANKKKSRSDNMHEGGDRAGRSS